MADEQQAQETFTNVQPIEQKSAVSTPAAQPNQAQETFTNVKPVAKAPKASPAPAVTSNPAEPKPAGLLDTVGAVAHNVHNISSAMDNKAPADITPQQQGVAEVGKGVRAGLLSLELWAMRNLLCSKRHKPPQRPLLQLI